MPSTTTNYLLALYDSLPAGDQLENFLDYRTAIAGISSASNMSIIDSAMNDNAVAITALEAKKNIIAVPASYVSPNTYLATVAGYTVYGTNDVIDVVLDTDSDTTVQLNINSIGLKSLMKINSSGTPVNLDNKNLLADRHYLFSYDGTRWVWIGATSADQLDIGGTATNFVAIASDGSLEDSTVKASDLSTIALDNLASTAVNTDITSDTDSTDGLGTTLKKWLAVFSDRIALGEMASAPADVAGDGQIWVKNSIPNALMFTDDDGNDYRMNLSELSVSITSVNLNAIINYKYLADISGLTASRNFVLPAGVAGDIVDLFIETGDDTYELILIGDTGITINGGSAATEWGRVYKTGGRVRFTASSSSNWNVFTDNRKIGARSGWTTPSFTNSWVDYGGGATPTGYIIDTQGMVRLRGLIKDGTMLQSAFTLPVEYRPATSQSLSVDSNGVYGRVDIASSGTVTPTVGSNVWMVLDGLCFPPA